MFDWMFSLVGSKVDFEDAPSAIVTNILSVSVSFYPLGVVDAQPGALMCIVVCSLGEPSEFDMEVVEDAE
jgi:hypothetical protein